MDSDQGAVVGVGAPRILAVTGNASLVMGLTFLPREWDVQSQSSDAPGPLDGDVVVLDVGSTSAGLDSTQRLSPGSRAVIIGTEAPDAAPPPGVLVLLRPYTMEELEQQIERLLLGDGEEGQAPPSPGLLAGVEHESSPDGRDLSAPAAPADGVFILKAGTERERRSDRHDRRSSLPARLFGRVAQGSISETLDGRADLDSGAARGLREEADARPDALAGSDDESPPPSPALAPGPPPPPVAASSSVPARTRIYERRTVETTEQQEEATGVAPRPMRWRARRQRGTPERERQLRQRLTRVLSATSELEQLIQEVPLLVDPSALGAGIVREVAHELEADSVALWRQDERGWHALAHRGLTRNEASWVVPPDQPLFSEVDATGGALLLDPVDEVQAAIVGIGGAHTSSFMAAAIAAGPGRYGILAVGCDRQLTENDLDLLAELALEMAPGLAVADQIQWLRDVSARHDPRGEDA